MELVEQLGFTAIDGGSIADFWRQQPASPVYVADMTEADLRTGLDAASPTRSEGFTGTADSPGSWADPK